MLAKVEFGLWVAALRAILSECQAAAASTVAATAALHSKRLARVDSSGVDPDLPRLDVAHPLLLASTATRFD